ncbi:MAG: hypothetical protein QM811_23970 [Pirellulales bacterium]
MSENDKKHRVLSDLANNHPMLIAIKDGITPQQIKAFTIHCFKPYFFNLNLDEDDHVVSSLVSESIRMVRIQTDLWSHGILNSTLNIYRTSAYSDPEQCFKTFNECWREVEQGVYGFWSIYNLRPKDLIPESEDYVFDQFRTLGSLLEGSIQPMLRELLSHSRITKGTDGSMRKIRELDFGVVVGELHDNTEMKSCFSPEPWGIRINQWRNIAQHQSFRLQGSKINIRYGKKTKINESWISVTDLVNVQERIFQIFNSISFARVIFSLDNHEHFKQGPDHVTTRLESKLVHLSSLFASQGFELLHIDEDDDNVEAVVRDPSGNISIERAAHASQFLLRIWIYFPVNKIRIQYLYSDSITMYFSADGSDCESASRDDMTLSDFANKVNFQSVQH